MHRGTPPPGFFIWIFFFSTLTNPISVCNKTWFRFSFQDQDIIHAWLQDLHFEEYFTLFVSAGYDMPTISKMTPEDLTAIGIKKPNHRKKLKAEIAQLNISDGLPEYIPVRMSWEGSNMTLRESEKLRFWGAGKE